MTNSKEIIWNSETGREIKVTVELITEKTYNLDGDICTTSCCDIKITACVDGGAIGTGEPSRRNGLPTGYVATIGKLLITQENLTAIESAINEIKASSDWTEKQAPAELESNHTCPKCHSYCYGDCEA